ncbi:YczE/YyaS/YitT family protein [Anaerosacchariphilus polymeriproducens]|uniref:Membrane protein YczE n=1 Tax=Anaerosacchariphilus polymeriproducens TaxID=1812858 RepID=A0A371AWL3_9FIRM|nr:hypothetical protein [Anaerosacchariphilus polymeriproducens]RDU23860.1 hypothetical protein DWV06_07620 [Anaerosacchariphilus polymeriproducens]
MEGKISKKYRCILACVGIFFAAVGVAFNAKAGLGNDPIGVFYDGVRSALNMSGSQLGVASNIINACLLLFVFVFGRKYINIGTVIHFLLYGNFVTVGTYAYLSIFGNSDLLLYKIIASVIGCLLLYLGVAIFITVDIGIDAMTGIVMTFKDKFGCEFKYVKWGFDIVLVVVGFVCGGKVGAITIATVIFAAPLIQFFAQKVKKLCIMHKI